MNRFWVIMYPNVLFVCVYWSSVLFSDICMFVWSDLIIGNLHQSSMFFKEYEILKEVELEETEEISVAEVEALPAEGIQST